MCDNKCTAKDAPPVSCVRGEGNRCRIARNRQRWLAWAEKNLTPEQVADGQRWLAWAEKNLTPEQVAEWTTMARKDCQ